MQYAPTVRALVKMFLAAGSRFGAILRFENLAARVAQ